MIKSYITDICGERRSSLLLSIYYLMTTCVNPNTNRLEFNGKPMNTMDICAYANMELSNFRKALRQLDEKKIIINIRTQKKDIYYVNPNYIRDESKKITDFPFLLVLFNDEENAPSREKALYFSNKKRRRKNSISEIIKKEL